MRRLMDAAAVREIIAEMEVAKTSDAARKAMARAALRLSNLTDCGRAVWQTELER